MFDPVTAVTGLARSGHVAPAAQSSAAPNVGHVGASGATRDFASVMADLAMDAIGVVKNGEAAGIAGIRGRVATQDVVEAVMAAEQTLQAAVSVRDKVVSAYTEISRMQI